MAQMTYNAPERIDTRNSNDVQAELNQMIEEGAADITFNMESLKYISSAGLRVLLFTQKKLAPAGSLVLTNVPDTVKEILDVTGFSSILTME